MLSRRLATAATATASVSTVSSITSATSRISALAAQLQPSRSRSTREMSSTPPIRFPRTPVQDDPSAPVVRTAGCLIIGDEVLNGKTRDSNSHYLAKYLFNLAIDLKRIEIIPDDEDDIIEAVRRFDSKYDFVITSGGIGPTHDDITYSSIAKAYGVELEYNDETIKRMEEMGKKRYDMSKQTEEQKKARLRMALFPKEADVLFVDEELWVPVVRLNKKVHILPGVPRLFERLLEGLGARYIKLPPDSEKPWRLLVHTKMPESSIAPFLTTLAERVKGEDIRVGSYPKFDKGVDVSLIGRDQNRLQELGQEVAKELKGEVVTQSKIGEE